MGCGKARSAVVCKFSMVKLEIPLLNAFAHQTSKQSSKSLVSDFGLSIRLRMVGGTIQELSTKESPQTPPKVTKKLCVPIRHNALWNTIKLNNFLEVEVGYIRCIIRVLTRNEVSHLRETVHHHHNSCLLYTSPSPRDGLLSRMPSSA